MKIVNYIIHTKIVILLLLIIISISLAYRYDNTSIGNLFTKIVLINNLPLLIIALLTLKINKRVMYLMLTIVLNILIVFLWVNKINYVHLLLIIIDFYLLFIIIKYRRSAQM